ncbi:MAG: hypothetical protein K1X89_14800 [Myxococcaceae bacterium]|nr:hypothetical protein [Myxococcaceae bacterium]
MIDRLRLATVALCCFAASGCHERKVTSTVNVTFERSRKLSVLAAAEAGNITDSDARLTRQLNIAEQVLKRYGKEDALTVLGDASKTLKEVGPKLGSHARISGWVSVSQLARRASGTDAAQAAATQAQAELEALPSLADRCQYLMGVAEEISHSEGEAAATALLGKGAEWAGDIKDSDERRSARLAFAVALFNLNAYESGVTTLRSEGDAAWSSDTMLALASKDADGVVGSVQAYASAPAAEAYAEPALGAMAARRLDSAGATLRARPAAPGAPAYGRAVGYETIFQGASQSRSTP